MAASDHLQRKLFYGGRELRDKISISRDVREHEGEDLHEMWDRKVEEAKVSEDWWYSPHGAGVHQSLHDYGWDGDPLLIGKNWDAELKPNTDGSFTSSDAHHRIASAADIEENYRGRNIWIPVEYVEYED